MLLIVDNYDSFTFNLAQLFGALGEEVRVVRNDAVTVADVQRMAPLAIVLSPGPGRPEDTGICRELVQKLAPNVPFFGVCLGFQLLCSVYGARVSRAHEPVHGRACDIVHDCTGVLADVPTPFVAARYHSLVVERDTLPIELVVNGWSADGTPMAVRHRDYPSHAVQFHPESFMTSHGASIARAFLALSRAFARRMLERSQHVGH